MRSLLLCAVAAFMPAGLLAQTVEQSLTACVRTEIDKYQPKSPYSESFRCEVGNRKPGRSTPSKGPYSVAIAYSGHVILSATATTTFKISEGGHTEPFISPRREKVTLALWCKAESKWYGKSGKYHVRVDGEKQRVATGIEQRRALTRCTKEIYPISKEEGQ